MTSDRTVTKRCKMQAMCKDFWECPAMLKCGRTEKAQAMSDNPQEAVAKVTEVSNSSDANAVIHFPQFNRR